LEEKYPAVAKDIPPPPPMGSLNLEDVRESLYFFS